MAEDKMLDLVIFGATGFTGRLAVREMSNVGKKYPGVSWGVAGRDRCKLVDVLEQAHRETGLNISGVKVITADVANEGSLRAMCGGVRVVVNCTGPYAKYGEPVVAAALAAGAHYVDVSAENQFTAMLEKKYDEMAREAGVYVINACGLSSVPVDLGVQYLEQSFEGTLNSVESYMTTHASSLSMLKNWRTGILKYSSWESMIHGMAQKTTSKEDLCKNMQPQLKKRPSIHRRGDGWCVPYPISDSFIVNRSQKHLFEKSYKRPVQYKPYITIPNFVFALFLIVLFVLIKILAKITFTRKILLKYPCLCSFGMVAYERNVGCTEGVYEYILIGNGWGKDDDITKAPNKNIIANIIVSGDDPAYTGTVVALLHCAFTIINEKRNMPIDGGVMTPGYAFYKTNLLQNLQLNTYVYKLKTAF